MSFANKLMPFLKSSKKPNSPELPVNGYPVNNRVAQHNASSMNGNGNTTTTTNTTTANNNNNRNSVRPSAHITTLVFQCQLAEGSRTAHVSGFSNMKEFYEKCAANYNINASDILYCTLNTPKVDMDQLLGAQIGLEDFIFIHRKGQRKEVEITKTEEYLGLTITDNGNGYAFIKKIREGSPAHQIKFIEAGDHIEKINNISMAGCRHYEVAKALKEIPIGATFTIRLIEPLKNGLQNIGPRTDSSAKKSVGSGRQTLRIRANGQMTVEDVPTDSMIVAIDKINALLESFMGINDSDLAAQIWELGKDKSNPTEFVKAVDDSDIQDFGFSNDFIFDFWGAISDAKSGRLSKTNNIVI